MAEDIASLKIRIDAVEAKVAAGELDKLTNAGKKAENSAQSLKSSFMSLRGSLAALGVGITVGQIVGLMDSYTKFTAQLKLATTSQKEFNQAYADVERIASIAQASIEETAILYSRVAKSVRDMGGNSKQAADITEALSLALKASGASAQEAATVMLQFSQAMGSGVLQGDEFRSLNEAAPRLMDDLAKSLGVARGELKQMASDGMITSDVLGNSLIKSLERLREDAKKTQTVGGGWQDVKNQFVLMVGEIDRATGLTKGLSVAFKEAAGAVRDMRTGTSGWLSTLLRSIPIVGEVLKPILAAQRLMGGKKGDSAPAPVSKPDLKPNEAGIKTRLAAFMTDTPLKDAIAINKAYADSLKLVNEAEKKGALSAELAARYRKQLAADLTKSLNSGSRSGRTKAEKETADVSGMGKAYADVAEAIQRLNEVDKTAIELLQEKLDAISNLDPAFKQWADNELKVAAAQEERRQRIAEDVEAQKRFNEQVKEVRYDVNPLLEYNDQIALLAKMYNMGRISAEEFSKASEKAQQKMLDFSETTKNDFEELKDAIEGWSRDAAQSIADFATGGKTSFKGMVDSMIAQITRLMTQKFITDPLFKAISGAIDGGSIGKFFGGLFSANGNAFAGGQLMAFANGGIVDKPTLFGYGGGKAGVMGEMGTEAILPLQRGSNGKLGVQTSGGSSQQVNVNNHFTISGNVDRRTQAQIAASVGVSVNRAMIRNR